MGLEDHLSPDGLLYAVLAFSWLEFLWEGYLSKRQRNIYKSVTAVPEELKSIMTAETFDKARLYALDKSNFGAVSGAFSQVMSTLIIWFAGFKFVWDFTGQFGA